MTEALEPEAGRTDETLSGIVSDEARAEFRRRSEAMERAARRAVQEALLRHKLLGQSIVVCRDGRVVEIPPEQIRVSAE